MRKLLLFVLLIPVFAFGEVEITTVHDSPNEIKIQMTLEGLLSKYNLEQWIYVTEVKVDETASTPHSHPVLTMSTGEEYLQSEMKLLASFLHEQFHWHLVKNGTAGREEYRAIIKTQFPAFKSERPFGSGTEGSTLSHIVVCYLEYKAFRDLVGEELATEILSKKSYYTWVYATILDPSNESKLEALINNYGLQIPTKNG